MKTCNSHVNTSGLWEVRDMFVYSTTYVRAWQLICRESQTLLLNLLFDKEGECKHVCSYSPLLSLLSSPLGVKWPICPNYERSALSPPQQSPNLAFWREAWEGASSCLTEQEFSKISTLHLIPHTSFDKSESALGIKITKTSGCLIHFLI